MKKSLVMVPILFGVFLGGIVFGWDRFYLVSISSQPSVPWVYDPISGCYELKTEEQTEEQIKNENEWDKVANMDFYSNDSYQKFLDDNHPLAGNYEASDIVRINSDFTSNKSSNFMLRKEVAEMFEGMAWAFSNAFDFKAKLTINSAWRSQAYQRQLINSCSVGRCAKPGTSEHEAGLALDLGVNGGNIKSGNGIYYQWLVDNAHKYGFHNSYQKGMEVDGKIVEPRHWRYVGVELATILHDNDKSFAEYFYQNIEARI